MTLTQNLAGRIFLDIFERIPYSVFAMAKSTKHWSQAKYEEFVRVWQSEMTTAEVAEKYKASMTWILAKAAFLRRRGVPLKQRMGSRKSRERALNYDKLTSLIATTAVPEAQECP